jgi:tripartite-type tricarboxylate transporter receptor subunit TctC
MESKQPSQSLIDSTGGSVSIVVPFPPGGIDLILQPMLPSLAKELGREVSIVNRPGGTGAVGTGEVARAKADGGTLLFASQGPLVYQPQVNAVDYDVQRSFVPVCRVTSTPSVLMVSSGSGLNSVKDVVAAARATPGRLVYSSPGPGGLPHIGMAAFEKLLGIELRHLPLAGAAAAIAALKEGKADLLAEQLPTAVALAGQGARIVGVFAPSRQASLPDVPTLVELGYEISFQSWNVLMAPAGTPAAVIDRWSRACRVALESAAPELNKKMGMAPAYLGSADTAAFIAAELVQARALAVRSGLAVRK